MNSSVSHPSVHPVDAPPLVTEGDRVRMRDIQGMPGTMGGLILRFSQFIFSLSSLSIMASTVDFISVTAFCYLVAAVGLQSLWSLSLAFIDIYALMVKRRMRNSRIVSLFTIGDGIHTKKRNCLEQSRMNALVFVKYNLALKDRHANRDNGTDPIVLEEMCDDDEWIVEKEGPTLRNDAAWLNIVDCFMEDNSNGVGESSRRRCRPRDLTKSLKGKNKEVQEDNGDFISSEDENEELDDMDIDLVNDMMARPHKQLDFKWKLTND